MKKIVVGFLAISVLGIAVLGIGGATVSALGNVSKPEKLAELTDKSVEEIIAERHETGKTYGEIADENGVLEEFQAYNHENRQNAAQGQMSNGHNSGRGQHLRDQENCDYNRYNDCADCDYSQQYNHQGHGRHHRQ